MILRNIACGLLTLLLVGCSSETDNSIKVFRYNQINHITSLDPAFAKSQNNIWAVNQLYNGLVRLDSSLNIVPDLAHSWSISADGLTYTFNLRKNVYFHENQCFENGKGRRLVSDDVVYSLNRLLDDNVASPGSWLFKGKVDTISPFVSVDDTTFTMQLMTPFLPMLGILTMQYCGIVPSEAVEYYGDKFRSQPVGTGPFVFKRWIENQALYMVKNENYWESGMPFIDGIKTLFIPDRKIAFLELLNGGIDYVPGLESSFINELLTREGNLKKEKEAIIRYKKSPYLNMEYLGINMEVVDADSPLGNKLVRKALNYGIDKSLMLMSLRNGVGKPAESGFVPYGLPSFNDKAVVGYDYNPEKAQSLLKEAGFPGGKGLETITLYTNNDYLDLTTFVAKQWERIGVKVVIDVLESAVLRDGMRKSQLSLFRASWIADYPDPESFLCMFYSKNPAPPNYTRYSNQEFDALYEKAISENDTKKRLEYYQEMDKIIVEDSPVIFLFYDQSANFYSSRVHGAQTNAINQLELKKIKLH